MKQYALAVHNKNQFLGYYCNGHFIICEYWDKRIQSQTIRNWSVELEELTKEDADYRFRFQEIEK